MAFLPMNSTEMTLPVLQLILERLNYFDRSRIRLRLRFSRRMRFLRHYERMKKRGEERLGSLLRLPWLSYLIQLTDPQIDSEINHSPENDLEDIEY